MLSVLVPLIPGLILWKWQQGNLKLILWLVISSVISDLLSLWLMNRRINTWPVINLFLLVQFSFLFQILGDQRKIILLRILFFACIGFGLYNFLFLQTPKALNSYTSYAAAILMIISALSFLYQLMNEIPVEKIQTLPLFWLAFGVLVYYGGNLFLFLFNNYLIAHLPKSHQTIWVLHNLLNITKNVFFFVTLWINYKSRTSRP